MAGRDGPEPEEGKDFRWVKAKNGNFLTRDFTKQADTPAAPPSATKTSKPRAKPKASPVSGATRSTANKVKKPSTLSGASRGTTGKVKAKSTGGGATGSWSPPKVKGHKGVPWPPSMKGYSK